MKRLIVSICGLFVLLFAVEAFAQGTTYVNPYVRRDGTYVPGHARTNPDSSRLNNWGTSGNVNPYTGERGHQNPYEGNVNQRPRGYHGYTTY